MDKEFEYLSDSHLAEKLLKKYCSYPELSRLPCRDLPVVTRRRLAIIVIRNYLETRFFELQMLIT